MFRIVGRGIWLGLHAGQALPASEMLTLGAEDGPARCKRPTKFDWYYGELYGGPLRCAVRVANKQQLADR
jgi:hypothetical protein